MTTSNNHEQTKTTSGKPSTEGTSQELEAALANPNLLMPFKEFLKVRGFANKEEFAASMNADPFPMFFGQMES
jgi:hypothetical protein